MAGVDEPVGLAPGVRASRRGRAAPRTSPPGRPSARPLGGRRRRGRRGARGSWRSCPRAPSGTTAAGPAPSGSTEAEASLRFSSGMFQASSASSHVSYGGGGTVEPVAEHLVPEPRERGRVGAVERDLDGERHQSSLSVGAVSVEVAEQGDLGAVVDHLAVDVGDQRGQRLVGVRALGRAARPGQALLAEAADALDPARRSPRRAGRAHRRRSRGTSTSRSRPAGRRSGRRCGRRGRRRRGGRAATRSWSPAPGPARGRRSRSVVRSPSTWTFQAPGTGSQRYSSSVRPSSRGRSWPVQWCSSWSSRSWFQSRSVVVVMATTLPPLADRIGPLSVAYSDHGVTRPNESSGCWRCCSSGRCGPAPSWPTGWG